MNNEDKILFELGVIKGVAEATQEQSSKNFTQVFKMLNGETPSVILKTAQQAEEKIDKHERNHFSPVKKTGVIIGAVGGLAGLWKFFEGWYNANLR